MNRQFRVLYREFLFRLVDREILSPGEGSASRLFGRLAAILILISIPFAAAIPGMGGNSLPREALLTSAWGAEHALIATTMLVVGLFAVLSWDAAYPNRNDVLVLLPLPVPASTIFAAKISALAVGLSVMAIVFNAIPGLILPLALAPSDASVLGFFFSPDIYRILFAYWLTMFAAGGFILCSVLILQGIAGQLPRGMSLRLSALLQLAAFCVLLLGYFLQPSLTSPKALTSAAAQHLLAWLPSYWFLGLFQQLNGSTNGPAGPVLVSLANRAWMSLAVAGTAAGITFFLSYFRVLRKIVEEPDIVRGSHRSRWLPPFGNSIETAITRFAIRSLFRSRRHRILLSFYSGIGFAIAILFLKTPLAQQLSASSAGSWHKANVPLLASSFVMMCAWILGVRIALSIPLELPANWIFRVTQVRPTVDYLASIRRAAYVLALAPVWIASAIVFLYLWPLRLAVGHLIVLILLGVTIAEFWLYSVRKIPFTCSYSPGKSNIHITFFLCLMLGLNATYWSATFERKALLDLSKYLWTTALLGVVALALLWRRAQADFNDERLQFEDELPPAITSLGLIGSGVVPMKS